MPDTPVLELRDVTKSYRLAGQAATVLKNASLKIHSGKITALVAPSGAGKSTLMHIAGLLSRPDHGQIIIKDQVCDALPDKVKARIRQQHIGFVYQQHMLMREMTCEQNTMLPAMLSGDSIATARDRAKAILQDLGLGHRLTHRPGEMSGGERQRCAIARALINKPACILADEPTGNLDPQTCDEVWGVFLNALKSKRAAALVVTHNAALAQRADRLLYLKNRRIVE